MSPRKSRSLTDADIERLRLATRRQDVDPHAPLCDPSSITWRVNREAALLAGGGCALLLQVAHPLVAAGVVAHSHYRTQPLQRLRNTLDLMLTIVFKDAADAIGAIREIERRHARVRGTLDADIGRYPRGTPYDANDPDLMLWVLATLIDTGLRVYEMLVAPLDAREKRAYYEQAQVTARMFGIPDERIPETWNEFQHYMRDMTDSDALAVGPAALDVASTIIDPPVVFGLKQAVQAANIFTVGLLPPTLREQYGYSWSPIHEAALRAAATAGRLAIPWLPDVVRQMPTARDAIARASTAREHPFTTTAPRADTPADASVA